MAETVLCECFREYANVYDKNHSVDLRIDNWELREWIYFKVRGKFYNAYPLKPSRHQRRDRCPGCVDVEIMGFTYLGAVLSNLKIPLMNKPQ